MRIRSIKPEFWRSDDIASLAIPDRLLFIGLWSYVDDSGVGVDRLALICADLFAPDLERDPPEVYGRVTGGLQELSRRGLITRYVVDGKPFLHICTWNQHQRIEKPSKPRYPLPTCENAILQEPSRNPPGALPDMSVPGAVEQGNRGTGEQGKATATRSGASAQPNGVVALFDAATETTAQTLVAEWLDNCPKRPPGDVIGQIAKHLKALLEEGIDSTDVRNGLAEWHRKGLHPRTLSSVVNEVMNARPQHRNGQDIDWDAAMQRAQAREATA